MSADLFSLSSFIRFGWSIKIVNLCKSIKYLSYTGTRGNGWSRGVILWVRLMHAFCFALWLKLTSAAPAATPLGCFVPLMCHLFAIPHFHMCSCHGKFVYDLSLVRVTWGPVVGQIDVILSATKGDPADAPPPLLEDPACAAYTCSEMPEERQSDLMLVIVVGTVCSKSIATAILSSVYLGESIFILATDASDHFSQQSNAACFLCHGWLLVASIGMSVDCAAFQLSRVAQSEVAVVNMQWTMYSVELARMSNGKQKLKCFSHSLSRTRTFTSPQVTQ